MTTAEDLAPDATAWARLQFAPAVCAGADGPVFWDELELDELGYTPPRLRRPFRGDGQPWSDDRGLMIFTDAAGLEAWLRA